MNGDGSAVRPERIAAAARALGGELSERMALYADALADTLAADLQLVAWDREQLIGQVQTRLAALRRRRFRTFGGPPVRVVERRDLPLEAIEATWEQLRRGRRVWVDHQPGACSGTIEFLRGIGKVLDLAVGARVLELSDAPWEDVPTESDLTQSAFRRMVPSPSDPSQWPVVGVFPPGPRVAVVESSADRELAAYVLARMSLRRSGTDRRAIKIAYVVGQLELIERHMHRLWVGVQLGSATSHDSFAGPVSDDVREAFAAACAAWSKHAGIETWCGGGTLERAGDAGLYLAPALYVTEWPPPDLPTDGPLLVVVRCTAEEARAGAEAAARQGGQVVVVGGRDDDYPGDVTHIRGALLVERLPPGLPEPRPA